MILKEKVHHPNDISFKYLQTTNPELLHKYLKLPGRFIRNYPSRIILRNGSEREMDWLMLVQKDDGEYLLINVEFQSKKVDNNKIEAIADYRDYAKTFYGIPVLSIIVITDGWKYSIREFEKSESDILRPKYIHMNVEEIEKKFINICEKIDNQEILTDEEALEIAILPMFVPKNNAKNITENLVYLLVKDKTIPEILKNDISYILGIMVRKYFKNSKKAKRLLKMTERVLKRSDLIEVLEFERQYQRQIDLDEINAIRQENSRKDSEINAIRQENSRKDSEINAIRQENDKKDEEILKLKMKLEENGIKY